MQRRIRRRAIAQKFFADRGTHLAAMIAYFALLSFVPLLFIALALLGLTGQADQDSFFVRELHKIFPGRSLDSILSAVRAIQENATTLGLVGAGALLWSSLSLFSVLESAFNIVYGRPNRSFLHGKALATLLMIGTVTATTVFAVTVSVLVSLWGVFVFLVSVYYVLTNERLTIRDVVPGAATAAVLLEGTFQLLPAYLRLSNDLPALQATGGPVVLLVWLYVMANLIVFGAEVNWWFWQRRGRANDMAAGLA